MEPNVDTDREPRPQINRRKTVLLADDDTDMRTLLADSMRREGYRVVEATTGVEMLDHLSDALLFRDAVRPDLIVSDQRMPGLHGTGILSGIRSSGWDTPFVLMSAYCGPLLEREAKALGVDAVFSKPFDVEDLLTAVVNLLHRKRPSVPREEAPTEEDWTRGVIRRWRYDL